MRLCVAVKRAAVAIDAPAGCPAGDDPGFCGEGGDCWGHGEMNGSSRGDDESLAGVRRVVALSCMAIGMLGQCRIDAVLEATGGWLLAYLPGHGRGARSVAPVSPNGQLLTRASATRRIAGPSIPSSL